MSSDSLFRVGEPVSLYYADGKNLEIQDIPVEYNTRFTQDLTSLTAGQSTFLIPAGNGVRHVLLVLNYLQSAIQVSGGVTNQGLYILPRGWGYNAVRSVTFKIGGSSMYTLSGAQLLARNLRLCRTGSQRNAMLQLGGNACTVTADFAQDQNAFIPISVFCPPSSDGVTLPIPGDLLSQPIQVQVDLNPSSSFWVTNTNPAALTGFIPSAFSRGYFQCEQLVMNNRADSLNNRANLNESAYDMPLLFDQQEQTVSVASGGLSQSLTLTGFRSGQVKKIQMWLTKNSDTLNPNRWYIPKSVQCLYAGVIYAQYDNYSSAIWNLMDGTAPASVDTPVFAQAGGGGGAVVASDGLSQWVDLQFGQPNGDSDFDATILVNGKRIDNGIVNLQVTPPSNDAYTLHAVYCYNSVVSFARGSAELRFD